MKILIVEDDRIQRAMLEKVLRSTEHEVVSVSDGLQAWEYYQHNKISIIITDWVMPEMDGVELCRRIRSADSGYYTYIIVLSGKNGKRDQVETLERGADDFITKPFDPKELLARVAAGERIIHLEDQHKRMLAIIGESRDKIRTVFDALREEIVTIDRQLEVVSANYSFIRAHGVNLKAVTGKPFTLFADSLTDDEGKPVGMEAVRQCFKTGDRNLTVIQMNDLQGHSRIKELSCLPVSNKSGETLQVILVSRDITEEREKTRKINELNLKLTGAIKQINHKNQTLESTLQQLKESQLRILQSEKMASIGQLAAGVAHEINNPTGFVSSNLKTLSDYQQGLMKVIPLYRKLVTEVKGQISGMGGAETLSSLADRILDLEASEDIDFILEDTPSLISESREGTQRIKKIVNDLKEFIHPGEDSKKETNINDIIESTLNIVWNEIKYKAVVEKDFGEIPTVWCHPQRINQVFMNVLVNAVHAIEKNGVIRITTRYADEWVEVGISDNGCGISEDNLPKIFDPFFTTKAVGKGTGLGLHLAYNIVTDHNGTIDVKSKIGEGTSFTIRLPIGSEPAAVKVRQPAKRGQAVSV